MPSFSPYNISAQFARSAIGRLNRALTGRISKPASRRHRREESPTMQPPRSGGSDSTQQRSPSYEQLAIKQEADDNNLADVHQTHHNSNMELGAEGDLDNDSSDDYGTPGVQDGRDEPIQSIEYRDEAQFGTGNSPDLRGGRYTEDIIDVTEEIRIVDDGHEDSEEELEPRINMDDYYESEDDFDDEYDVDSEDLAGYRVERTKVRGIEAWPQEVARAHKAIALRGTYSLMPLSWNWDFIDHPFVEGLFAPAHNEKKVLFQQESNQFRATRALRNLFELHIRICAYRQDRLHDKIADLIDKEIRAYNRSVGKDIKLHGYRDYASPIFIIKFSNLNNIPRRKRETLGQWVHQQAMQACQARVEQYHAEWARHEVDSYPRFIYTFVIIQQTVLIWMIDTDMSEVEEPYVLASIDMSKRTAWLETSLAIAITMHLAKESICAHRGGLPLVKEQNGDPDA